MPIPRTECPACGYSALHYKSLAYTTHVIVTYLCALCHHTFDVEHGVRGGVEWGQKVDLSPRDQGGAGSEPRGGVLEERTLEEGQGSKPLAHKAPFQVLSTICAETGDLDVGNNITVSKLNPLLKLSGDLEDNPNSTARGIPQDHDIYVSTLGAKT